MMYHNIVFLTSLLLLQVGNSRDIIIPGQALKDGDILISSGKNFVLGFFSPGNSSNRYVGIWYNKVPERTVVWVANRDSPVNDTSGFLSVNKGGNLVIHGENHSTPLWSSNVSAVAEAGNRSAQLLDTGNLVLFHDQTKNAIAWQSFDHPTDTILPFMKYGMDRRTGKSQTLTSWKSHDDPGTGDYQFKWEPSESSEVFLYKGSERIWRTGSWNGIGWSGVPAMTPHFIFNVSYVDNDEEVSIAYSIKNPSVISRMVMNESGTIERLTWQPAENRWNKFWWAPNEQCDYYDHCGLFSNCNPYNLSEFECTCLPGYEPTVQKEWYLRDALHGCKMKNIEQTCRKGEGFVKLTHTKIPETTTAQINKILGLEACEELCLKNCSCTAYGNANVTAGGSGCITWYGDLIDMRQFSNGGQDMYIRVTAAELVQYLEHSEVSGGKRVLITVVVCVVSVIVAISGVYLLWTKLKGKRVQRTLFSMNLIPYEGSRKGTEKEESAENADVTVFDLRTIISATDNFSPANKLGEGGFGQVYRGLLNNGQQIAVKRLSRSSGQGTEEFKNEVTLIAKLQHRNLVKLFGCCIQQDEKMLVYEYLPNKGLDTFIFDGARASLLDWRRRFEIIMGITRGMLYLHQDSRLRIIHRDLKASNILLDAAMNPKISDFGMARIFGADQMEANTNRVVGTYGYMSPEYAMEGQFSLKSDVFSFGVLLLEIISGKKNNSQYHENTVNLIGYVWDLWKEDLARDIVDPSLGESYDVHQVMRCIHIGLLCVQEFPTDRPTMSEVVFMLCNEITLPSPNHPAFIFRKGGNFNAYSSSASLGARSVNDMSITTVEPR